MGWNPNLSRLQKMCIIAVGLLVSTYFMNTYPVYIAEITGVDEYVLWDAPAYLFNRIVAAFIVFLLVYKEKVPYFDEYREQELREAMM